jgi:DNA-binding CsgD family transcriptional regulator
MAADSARLVELAERALPFARAAGEPTCEASAQALLADLDIAMGRPEAALERTRATAARATAAGAGLALALAINPQTLAQVTLGDLAGARTVLEETVSTGVDHGFVLAFATAVLAETLRIGDEPIGAEARAGEVCAIGERIGSPLHIASGKEILGRLAAGRNEWPRAETLLHEALGLRIERDIILHIPQTLDALAEVAVGLQSHEEAARTLGIAARVRADLGLVRWAPDAPRVAQLEQAIREALGDEAYGTAHREGRELPLDDALTWIRGVRGERKRPDHGWASLTPTELRVAALVAEGLTNPQIGERMFISRGTVKVHLSHIFAKLNIATRSELATAATRQAATQQPP